MMTGTNSTDDGGRLNSSSSCNNNNTTLLSSLNNGTTPSSPIITANTTNNGLLCKQEELDVVINTNNNGGSVIVPSKPHTTTNQDNGHNMVLESKQQQLLTKPLLSLVDYEYLLKLETDLSNQEDNIIDEGYLKYVAEDYDKLGDCYGSKFEKSCLDQIGLEVQKQSVLVVENSESNSNNTIINTSTTASTVNDKQQEEEVLSLKNLEQIDNKPNVITKTLEEIFDSVCDEFLDINTYEEILTQQQEGEKNEKKRKPCGDGVSIHAWKNRLIRSTNQPTLLLSSSMRRKKRTKRNEQERGSFQVAFSIPMNNFNIHQVVENFQNCISSHHNFIEHASNLRIKRNWIESMNSEQAEIRNQVEQFSKALIHERLNETLKNQHDHNTKALTNSTATTTTTTNGTKATPGVVVNNIKHSKMHQLSKEVALKVKENQTKSITERDNNLGSTSSVLSDRMNSFWKKHEKEISEKRKRKKKEEEEKEEALRQQRKLNFLLSQTELYSHFMSKKTITSSSSSTAATAGEESEESSASSEGNAAQSALQASQRQKQFTEDFDKDIEKYRAQPSSSSSIEEDENMEEVDETIQEPNIFNGSLKKYQLKGMKWLVSLYEQGINGILADEMGLGKTIQTIAFMAYLAEKKSIWGPTLIITPSSTLHNWQQEFEKFCPTLRVLPYWGALKERKLLRKYWTNPDKLYQKDSPFHVVVSSYGLILEDEKYFKKVKWQYLILDEAHAIKSSKSLRWKTLLSVKCRNRMLLTGTPIQNNMKELWALLHFIMPSIFDSHDEFNDWFSKDIESHATKEQDTKLNEQQLARLHMILKPFMLRRVKKDVESEMAPKTEIVLPCGLSSLQGETYYRIKDDFKKSSSSNKKKKVSSATAVDATSKTALMNIVMQLKKACNHTHLFKEFRQHTLSPFPFTTPISFLKHIPGRVYDECERLTNPIQFHLPKLVFRELTSQGSLMIDSNSLMVSNRFDIYNMANLLDHFGTFAYFLTVDNLWKLYKLRNLKNRIVEFRDNRKSGYQFLMDEILSLHLNNHIERCNMLIQSVEVHYRNHRDLLKKLSECCNEKVIAPPIEIKCSDKSCDNLMTPVKTTRFIDNKFLYNNQFIYDTFNHSRISLPSVSKLIADSGKLQILDQLLSKLKQEGHRVLIFCQMTKMMDLLEEYMYKRRYTFFRLDGSTGISERRDMVDAFQNQRVDPVFAFLLSTKAGGLGITLTAADTVIFYDSDWNPTLDAQAMDRVHRIGQTKPVTIYRLITKNSVEERILAIAKQKSTIQETVYKGQFKMQEDGINKEEEDDLLNEEDDEAVESAVVVDDAGDLDEKEMMSLLLD